MTQGEVKVLDFGLALEAGQPGHTSGSLVYMAPEVLEEAPASPAANLYTASVLAYEPFAGRYPFGTTNVSALIDAILDEAPDLSRLPPEIAPLVARLLTKTPGERSPRRGILEAWERHTV